MPDRQISASFTIETEEGRRNLERLVESMVQMGDAGVAAAPRITQALVNVQREYDKVEQKIVEGKNVTVSSVGLMAVQYDRLKAEIREAFGTLENAPKEVQEAFRKAGTQIEQTTVKIRGATNAADDLKREVAAGGEQWGGLGDAVTKALGPMGASAAKFGLVTAAFREGVGIGNQLNQLFGTDMSEWEEVVGRFGAKGGAVIKALSDSAVSTANLVMAVLSGDMEEIKKAWKDLDSTAETTFDTLKDSVTLYGAEWDAAHPKVARATEATRDHEKAVNALAESQKQAAEQQRKLTADLEAHRQKLADATQAVATLAAAQEAAETTAAAAAANARTRNADMEYQGRQLDAVTQQLAAQRDEVQRLADKYGETNPVTTQAREKQEQLEGAVQRTRQQYEQAERDVERYKDQEADALQVAQSAGEERDKQTEKLKQETEATNEAAWAKLQLIAGADEHVRAYKESAKASGDLATAQNTVTTATTGSTDGVSRQTIALRDVEQVAKVAGESFRSMGETLDASVAIYERIVAMTAQAVENTDRLADSTDRLTRSMLALNAATDEAAGGGGSVGGQSSNAPGFNNVTEGD